MVGEGWGWKTRPHPRVQQSVSLYLVRSPEDRAGLMHAAFPRHSVNTATAPWLMIE